ncbi:hypothetical protein ACHAWF_017881 [Thalassiosira exigua]
MPELPEVEHFRRILLPLVDGGGTSVVSLECPPPAPTKRFPSSEVVDKINEGGYVMKEVLRKGKVLCAVLQKAKKAGAERAKQTPTASGADARSKADAEADEEREITGNEPTLYLSLHMGMTGRISSPGRVLGLESLSEDDPYPPPHTHLILKSNGTEASFSDPRRFGSVLVDAGADCEVGSREDRIPTFRDIAQDALLASEAHCKGPKRRPTDGVAEDAARGVALAERLANRKKGIKGLLLDQRAVVSGIGNWVADEILYRSRVHPDQSYLTPKEAEAVAREMYYVLSTAVQCLDAGEGFPEEWIFHRRWRNGGGGGTAKDYNGRTIAFVQSGGRSTAVVPSLQKLVGRKSLAQTAKTKKVPKSRNETDGKENKTAKKGPGATTKAAASDKGSKGRDVRSEKRPRTAKNAGRNAKTTRATEDGHGSEANVARGRKRKRSEESVRKPATRPTRRSERLKKR